MARTENDRGLCGMIAGSLNGGAEEWSLITRNSSNKTMKSKLIILSIATLLGCVSCNTIGGVGKDVEAVGSDINSAARSTSRAM